MSTKNKSFLSIFIIACVLLVGAFSFPYFKLEESIDMTPSQKKALEDMGPFIERNKEKVVFSIPYPEDTDPESVVTTLIEGLQLQFGDTITDFEYSSDFSPLDFDEYVLAHPYIFLDTNDYKEIERKIELPAMISQMKRNKASLSGYSGFGQSYRIQNDPLGISTLVYNRLRSSLQNRKSISDDGYFTTPDGSKLLIQARFNHSIDNMKFVHLISDHLNEFKKQWNLQHQEALDYFGIFLIAEANAKQIKSDIILTINLALVLILGLLIYFYRSLKTILFFVTPGIFGILCALLVIQAFQGGISILALSASAIIMGIVVDYSFHFFSHLQIEKDPFKTRKNIAGPLVISSTTTILAFFSLMLAESQSLHDFGLFTGLSLTFTLLFILLLLPSLLVHRRTKELKENAVFFKLGRLLDFKEKKVKPIWTLLFLGGTVVMFIFAQNVQFESNIQALNYYPEELKAKELELLNINPDHDKHVTIIASSTDKELALEANFQLSERLLQAQNADSTIQFAQTGAIIIPKSVCDRRLALWNFFWDENSDDALTKFDWTCDSTGFNQQGFAPFYELIDEAVIDKYPIDFALQFTSMQNVILQQDKWSILSTVTLPKEKYLTFTKSIEEMDHILVVDGSKVATETSDAIQSEFNTLFWIASIIVLLAMLAIYGRIELTLISFLPMVISWIWILGISHLFEIHFNFINIMLASVIFGLGDDFAIFITDGLIAKYKSKSTVLTSHKTGILLSSISTVVGTGVLYLGVHPAIKSIAPITVLGIAVISQFSFIIQPVLFRFFITNRTDKNKPPLRMLEIILSTYAFSLFFIGSFITTLVTAILRAIPLLPKKSKKFIVHRMIQACCLILLYTVFNVKKRHFGKEHLDFKKPSILIANHSSFLDILSMAALSPKVIILVGPWVYNSPIFGWFIRFADYIPAFLPIESQLDKIEQLVKQGYSIVIFPEGHRSKDGVIKRFHKGAFYLSEKLQIPVTPVLLHGYHRTLPKSEYYVKGSYLNLKALAPIPFNDPRFSTNYSEKTKEVLTYFRKEFDIYTKERENADYWKHFLTSNYLYKGPVLEWYFRIKYRYEKSNYEWLDQRIGESETVYDLGCGYGFLSYFLKLRANKRSIQGIDYDETKIKVAQNGYLMQPGLDFETGDLSDIELKKADVFILSDVLHYLQPDDQFTLIENCVNHLNSKGRIIVKDALSDKAEAHEWTKRSERWSTQWIKFNKTKNDLHFISVNQIESWAKKLNLQFEILASSDQSSNTWIEFTSRVTE